MNINLGLKKFVRWLNSKEEDEIVGQAYPQNSNNGVVSNYIYERVNKNGGRVVHISVISDSYGVNYVKDGVCGCLGGELPEFLVNLNHAINAKCERGQVLVAIEVLTILKLIKEEV